MKKYKFAILAATAALVAIGGLTALGLTQVAAAGNTTYPAIIENIAKAFNVEPSKVQEIFENTRQQEKEERLSQLVTDGKITEAQKQALIKFHDEIDTERDKLKAEGKTRAEIREALKSTMEEHRQWLKDQGIEDALRPEKGERGGPDGVGIHRMMF